MGIRQTLTNNTMEFTPQALSQFDSSLGILIQVNDVTEEVTYKYTDEEETRTSEILFDQDGDPYFRTDYDVVHYLSEFVKIV